MSTETEEERLQREQQQREAERAAATARAERVRAARGNRDDEDEEEGAGPSGMEDAARTLSAAQPTGTTLSTTKVGGCPVLHRVCTCSHGWVTGRCSAPALRSVPQGGCVVTRTCTGTRVGQL